MSFDPDALHRASFEIQRHFGREGSIFGIKACEEIARIALTAYGAVPEEQRSEVPPEVKLAIRVAINHLEPGWENTKAIIQAWLDGRLEQFGPQNHGCPS